MSKKIIMACMALVALAAFALPASASAANDPQLTHPTGTLLNPTTGSCTGVGGTICITGTQVGHSSLYSTSGTKELTCSTGTMTGYLLKNSGGTVEGEIHSASFGGTGEQVAGEPHRECTGVGFFSANTTVTVKSVPWCLKSTPLMAEDEFQVSGGKCGAAAAKITFTLLPTGFGECTYQATQTSIKGTYTTDTTGDAILTVNKTNSNAGFTKTAGSFFCPSSGEIEMSFTLETDNAAKAEPLYIS